MRSIPITRKPITRLVALAFFAILMLFFATDFISPDAWTATSIGEICARMNLYLEKNGRLPETLEELPWREGYDNSIADGWGRRILYTFDREQRKIRLVSYGRDGKPGGIGKNRDFILEATLDARGLLPLEELEVKPF